MTSERWAAVGEVALLYAAHLVEEACAGPLADPNVVGARPLTGRWLPGALSIQAGEAVLMPGDWITTIARVSDAADTDEGELLVVDTAAQNQRGELLAQARSSFLIPSQQPPARPVSSPGTPSASKSHRTHPEIFDFVRPSVIEAPQGHRSGDPLPRITPLRNAVETLVASVSPRLRSLSVRFAKEMYSGIAVVTHGRRRASRPGLLTVDFATIDRKGDPILSDGLAEISEA